jgi:uncharacterized membrane protein YfcA
VSTSGAVTTFILLILAIGGIMLVVRGADGWEDWVVLGVVICAVVGGAIAVWQRQYPAASKKRVFTRDSDSKW